jgi:DOPA 4,5-dioxygenase
VDGVDYPSLAVSQTSNLKVIDDRERNDDGKSLKNPQHGILSKAYEEFPDPLSKGRRGGFDIHIYHFQVRQLVDFMKMVQY